MFLFAVDMAETLIEVGGGGGCIQIFMFCPMSFFSNQIHIDQFENKNGQADHEYMNIHPPINVLVSALAVGEMSWKKSVKCSVILTIQRSIPSLAFSQLLGVPVTEKPELSPLQVLIVVSVSSAPYKNKL